MISIYYDEVSIDGETWVRVTGGMDVQFYPWHRSVTLVRRGEKPKRSIADDLGDEYAKTKTAHAVHNAVSATIREVSKALRTVFPLANNPLSRDLSLASADWLEDHFLTPR